MGWFGKDEVDAVGDTSVKITGGLRNLFTGEIPPEIVQEMDRLDTEATNKRWEADSKVPWYKSSRSIVLLLLNTNLVFLLWVNPELPKYWAEAYISLLMLVNGAFFGGKSAEYMKARMAP